MMKMKALLAVFGIVVFATGNVFALTTIPLQCSNALPDGNDYATVTIELLPDACSGYDGVRITVAANQSVLLPTETEHGIQNYGIQRFGFNYNGDPESLDITSYEDDGVTVELSWSLIYGQNVSEFGLFAELLQGTGKHRHDPFISEICKTDTDLTEADFNVANALGNNFVTHIADFYFNETYYETDSAYFSECPTLISLASFDAQAGNGEVLLEWETASEIDNAGFNLYRSEDGGAYEQINASLIPAEGYPTEGAVYEFVDSDVKNRTKYSYKLEDVDINGEAVQHGPVSATPRLIYGIGK
ncbi:hypothetical protein ACFL43_04775 [Thermodesulfobacteriota bacterium]